MENNFNLGYINMDKKQIAVQKRKATILKKRQLKENKKIQNESMKLLNAGFAFTNEKNNVSDKFKIADDIKAQRQRKNMRETLTLLQVQLIICFTQEPSTMFMQ